MAISDAVFQVAYLESRVRDRGGAFINVLHSEFGVAGDGTRDDRVALQGVLDAVAALPGRHTVYFPPGDYLIDSYVADPYGGLGALTIRGDNIDILGAGPHHANLVVGPNFTGDQRYLLELEGDIYDANTRARARKNCTISRMGFRGRGQGVLGDTLPGGVHGAPWARNLVVDGCHFYNLGGSGGVDLSSCFSSKVINCTFDTCGVGLTGSGNLATHTLQVHDNLFRNCFESVNMQFGGWCSIQNNMLHYTAEHTQRYARCGIRVQGQRGTVVRGNVVDAHLLGATQRLEQAIIVGGQHPTADDVIDGVPALNGYPSHCVIEGNHVTGGVNVGIGLYGASDCVVASNTIGNNDAFYNPSYGFQQVDRGIELGANAAVSPPAKSLRNIVHGNIVKCISYALREFPGDTGDNIVCDNSFQSTSVSSPVLRNTTPPLSRISRNRGYVTEASGEATIGGTANPGSSVTVNHGLSLTPARAKFTTQLLNSGNAGVKLQILAVPTATQVVFQTTNALGAAVDPGGSGYTFGWTYRE